MSIDLSSEPIAQTDVQQFCVEMMTRLDIQRRVERFCDVILEVGSGDDQARLKAHRIVLCAASPFFYNALNSDMKEKKEGVIRLEETSKAVMEEVLEYLYTGHVDINEQNSYDLMAVADYFLLSSLKVLCVNAIIQSLSVRNCILAYYLAVQYQCPELQQKAREYTCANFMSVAESEDFLNLNIKQVEEWISSDEIKINGEEEVFQVIVNWMETNNITEHETFFELFCHVRLVYLSRSYLSDVIMPHSLVKDNEKCMAFALNAMEEVSSGSEECFFAQAPRSCLKTHEDCLVAFGKKHTFGYLPSENNWYLLSKRKGSRRIGACRGKLYDVRKNSAGLLTMKEYNPSVNTWAPTESSGEDVPSVISTCVVTFQGCLYYIGGRKDETELSDKVQKYNPATNRWQEVAPLSIARRGVCGVTDRNYLYAIGGVSGDECLDVVERFDPEENCWNRVASTIEKKAFSCAAEVRGKVFLFGGFTGRSRSYASIKIELYDPATNVWTGIESMDAPKVSFKAVSFKGDVFVIGFWGTDDPDALQCLLQVYNVDQSEWRPCSIIPHRAGPFLHALAPLRIPRDVLNTCKIVS